jgi:hypothetical protein
MFRSSTACPTNTRAQTSFKQKFLTEIKGLLLLKAFFINFAKRQTTVLRKFFPLDKNYVLEEAQLSLKQALLQHLVDYVKVEYLLRSNPLGLADETALKIQQHSNTDFRHLNEFYLNLMGIFRFRNYSDNQLQFLFDGRGDFEKYQQEWSSQFKMWTKEFCKHPNFMRAILDLTVFYPTDSPVLMVDSRMHVFISNFFEVKIHPQKGIIRKSA